MKHNTILEEFEEITNEILEGHSSRVFLSKDGISIPVEFFMDSEYAGDIEEEVLLVCLQDDGEIENRKAMKKVPVWNISTRCIVDGNETVFPVHERVKANTKKEIALAMVAGVESVALSNQWVVL